MKKKIINTILFLSFLAGLFVILFRADFVLRQKEYAGAQYMFANLEPDTVDVVFIGNSHQFCSINTEILYYEYGIDSFMLASSAQTVPMSYYAAMEAIELQHPDMIVFEVSYCANDFRTVSDEMSHCFFDGMPNCEAKGLAIQDLIDKEDWINYYIPLGLYHSRWKELEEDDYAVVTVTERGGVCYPEIGQNWEIPVIAQNETSPMPEEMEKYMDLLVEMCAENDVKLVLYTVPFNTLWGSEEEVADLYERQKIFNYIGEYAEEKGVDYYNLFYEIEEIGLMPETDWKDTQHLNASGQEKLTRYMVENGYFSF